MVPCLWHNVELPLNFMVASSSITALFQVLLGFPGFLRAMHMTQPWPPSSLPCFSGDVFACPPVCFVNMPSLSVFPCVLWWLVERMAGPSLSLQTTRTRSTECLRVYLQPCLTLDWMGNYDDTAFKVLTACLDNRCEFWWDSTAKPMSSRACSCFSYGNYKEQYKYSHNKCTSWCHHDVTIWIICHLNLVAERYEFKCN